MVKRSLGARALAFTTPVWVIGTYDESGRPNVMTASWAGICCSRPPSVAVSLRRATYTYGCLTARKAFTVGVPDSGHAAAADFFGIASGRDVDKLAAAGLTAVASEVVDAPYVAELPLVLECRLSHTVELGLHTLFVGEILDVKADEEVLGEDGLPVPERVRPFSYAPETRAYHALGERLGEAYRLGKDLAGRR